jgi:hypothetical protein
MTLHILFLSSDFVSNEMSLFRGVVFLAEPSKGPVIVMAKYIRNKKSKRKKKLVIRNPILF